MVLLHLVMELPVDFKAVGMLPYQWAKHLHRMHVLPVWCMLYVRNAGNNLTVFVLNYPLVSDLATHLGVKRGLVKD